MNIHIPNDPAAYGETSDTDIATVKKRMLRIAHSIGAEPVYYDDVLTLERQNGDAVDMNLSDRVFELAMECAEPRLSDSTELTLAVMAARSEFPFDVDF